jgi:hypothetical protein
MQKTAWLLRPSSVQHVPVEVCAVCNAALRCVASGRLFAVVGSHYVQAAGIYRVPTQLDILLLSLLHNNILFAGLARVSAP